MTAILTHLARYVGHYKGVSINHEQQAFVGELELSELLAGRGAQLNFTAFAQGSRENVFHSEISIIANNASGSLSLLNLNTNTQFMAEHRLTSDTQTASQRSLIFRFGALEDEQTFREDICMDLLSDLRIGYHYSWGLPGGEFAYRSGVVMERLR